jgi:mono/diheme cytochrome c family protein
MRPDLKGRTKMKHSILAIATLGCLATLVACSGETTEVSSTTSSFSTDATATADATITTETVQPDSTAADAGEQITEGAKMIGRGIKEEARQAVAVSGAAMEQAGQALQDKAEAAAPVAVGDVANGAAIFKGKCVSCHGADASGNTPIGKKNNILDFRSSAVQDLTDTELSLMIANGKPGGMSATSHKSKALTPKQIEDVIAYVRSLRG